MKCYQFNQNYIHQRGFTLVELIIVVLLVGILAINVGTRFFSNSSFADRNVADELVEAIRYAQHVAMSRVGGTGNTIRIITTANNYSIVHFNSTTSTSTPIPNPNRSGDYTVPLPAGTSLSAETINFNGLGQPDTALDKSITIGAGNLVVTIETETGYAYY